MKSSSCFGNASCVTDVWSPYRITPIHWLMAQRRPWRTHVVSLYWRTRHLLLRFLCLHEVAILPFSCDFLAQYYIFRTRILRLHFGNTAELCSPRGEVPCNIAAVNRRACDSLLAMTHTVSVLYVWGFRMHAMQFMGFQNVNFVRISVS